MLFGGNRGRAGFAPVDGQPPLLPDWRGIDPAVAMSSRGGMASPYVLTAAASPAADAPPPGMGGGTPSPQSIAGPMGGGLPAVSAPPPAPARRPGMFGNRAPLSIEGAAPLNPTLAAPDVGTAPQIKPHFFDKGGLGSKLLRGLGEFALQYSASNGNQGALMTLQNRAWQQRQKQLWGREDAQRAEDREWAIQDRDAKLNMPEYFMSGRDRVRYDPRTGQSSVVYDGAEDFQTYASTLGYQPGTPDYNRAVSDYVLRGSGETATENRAELQDARFRHQGFLKSQPTFRDLHPRPAGGRGGGGRNPTMAGAMAPLLAKVARGEQLTPAEQQAWNMYRPPSRPRGGGGGAVAPAGAAPGGQPGGGIPVGSTASGPNGQKLKWDGTRWNPVR